MLAVKDPSSRGVLHNEFQNILNQDHKQQRTMQASFLLSGYRAQNWKVHLNGSPGQCEQGDTHQQARRIPAGSSVFCRFFLQIRSVFVILGTKLVNTLRKLLDCFIQKGNLVALRLILLDIVVSQMTGQNGCNSRMLIKLVFYIVVHDTVSLPSCP